jgi:hypothetical protein
MTTQLKLHWITKRRELYDCNERPTHDPHLQNAQPHVVVPFNGDDTPPATFRELIERGCSLREQAP